MSARTYVPANHTLKPAEFRLFRDFMYKHAGIRLSEQKVALVQGRLKKRLQKLGLPTYRAYYDYLSDPAHKDEFQECLNALTTNETFFFRHKNHWDYLMQVFLEEWKRANPTGGTFRIWSAACSSGEEPYSMAIALHDALRAKESWGIHVDATDINQDVLRRAETATYGAYAVQKLTERCLRRCFLVDAANASYRVKPEIARHVHFRPHNLQQASHGPLYDAIFVRNVMIYFDEASKERVIRNLSDRLKSGGALVLGGAETLSACHDLYTYVRPTIYRKR